MFRLTAVDFDVPTGSWRTVGVMTAGVGDSVLVGREGDLPVAIDPIDSGVSRRALTVTVDPAHWELEVTNSNHAWIHPWGQRPTWVESGTTVPPGTSKWRWQMVIDRPVWAANSASSVFHSRSRDPFDAATPGAIRRGCRA